MTRHSRLLLVVVTLLWCSGSQAQTDGTAGMGAMGSMSGESVPAHATQPAMDPKAASGTAWQPAASPMAARHFSAGEWDLMLHYNAFLTYDQQGGPRGANQVGSVNWGMLMGTRPLGVGALSLRGMASLEPATVGGNGYPLLFQSGESWNGKPLVDRQHPHDLFMELSARYDQPVGNDINGFVYVAPVGEPALGPVAYPHRASSLLFPLAPLGHHWEDSTHISFGVVTLGASRGKWQAETSTFTGREPDENRWDLDPIHLDSFSGRLTWNFDDHWSTSGSCGFIHSPERLDPSLDLHRSVLAAMYASPMGEETSIAATAVLGRNSESTVYSDSHLLEATITRRYRHHLFFRWEQVEKSSRELNLATEENLHRIQSGTLGYLYDTAWGSQVIGIGAAVSLYAVPPELRANYGSSPTSFLIYLQLRPAETTPMGMPAHR